MMELLETLEIEQNVIALYDDFMSKNYGSTESTEGAWYFYGLLIFAGISIVRIIDEPNDAGISLEVVERNNSICLEDEMADLDLKASVGQHFMVVHAVNMNEPDANYFNYLYGNRSKCVAGECDTNEFLRTLLELDKTTLFLEPIKNYSNHPLALPGASESLIVSVPDNVKRDWNSGVSLYELAMSNGISPLRIVAAADEFGNINAKPDPQYLSDRVLCAILRSSGRALDLICMKYAAKFSDVTRVLLRTGNDEGYFFGIKYSLNDIRNVLEESQKSSITMDRIARNTKVHVPKVSKWIEEFS